MSVIGKERVASAQPHLINPHFGGGFFCALKPYQVTVIPESRVMSFFSLPEPG